MRIVLSFYQMGRSIRGSTAKLMKKAIMRYSVKKKKTG